VGGRLPRGSTSQSDTSTRSPPPHPSPPPANPYPGVGIRPWRVLYGSAGSLQGRIEIDLNRPVASIVPHPAAHFFTKVV